MAASHGWRLFMTPQTWSNTERVDSEVSMDIRKFHNESTVAFPNPFFMPDLTQTSWIHEIEDIVDERPEYQPYNLAS